jgi:amidophosphoribosyltransferase
MLMCMLVIHTCALCLQMGNYLADKIRAERDLSEIDVVCPVPDTSRVSALQCALQLELPYEEGLTKNRYIARTFIMPGELSAV